MTYCNEEDGLRRVKQDALDHPIFLLKRILCVLLVQCVDKDGIRNAFGHDSSKVAALIVPGHVAKILWMGDDTAKRGALALFSGKLPADQRFGD